jgi:hypothetical protein
MAVKVFLFSDHSNFYSEFFYLPPFTLFRKNVFGETSFLVWKHMVMKWGNGGFFLFFQKSCNFVKITAFFGKNKKKYTISGPCVWTIVTLS